MERAAGEGKSGACWPRVCAVMGDKNEEEEEKENRKKKKRRRIKEE